MPHPLVSAVIPTFNRREMLKEAIASVKAQTYSPIEIIVVDDGSNDGTWEMLGQEEGTRSFRTKDGTCKPAAAEKTPAFGWAGVSAARNLGIQKARGEFIALLDSDDFWKQEKIEHQIRYLENHPDVSICQTEEIWIRRGRRVNPKKYHQKKGGYIFDIGLARCMVSPSAVLMRRAFFNRVGYFDESYPVCEDYELWLRAAWCMPIGLLEAPLTVKRGGHKDQLSQNHSLDYYRIRALAKLLKGNLLSFEQQAAAIEELKRKCEIYRKGCAQRNKMKEAHFMLDILGVYRTAP